MNNVSPFKLLLLGCLWGLSAIGCGGGTSQKLTLGASCVLNTDCNNPLACKFTRCHRQCNETRDCDAGLRCVKVDGIGVCQLPAEAAFVCGETSCATPLICSVDNKCRGTCTTATDCAGNQACVAGTTSGSKVCTETNETITPATDGGATGTGGTGGADAGVDSSMMGSGGSAPDGAASDGDAPDEPVTNPDTASPDTAEVAVDTGPAGSYVAPAGPLVIALSAATEPVAPTGRVHFTITVSNISIHAVDAVTVLMRTPTGVQYNYVADAQPNGYCNGGCNPGAESKWVLGTLPAGQTRTITISATILQTVGVGDVISAAVDLTATGTNPLKATRDIRILTNPSAQLALGTLKDPVTAGETFTYDLDVGQLGTAALAGAELRASLPPGVTIKTMSDGGTMVSAREVTWTLGAVPVGGLLHRTVDVTVEPGVPAGALLSARASLKFDGGADVDLTADRTVSVLGVASPLKLDVAASVNPVLPTGRVLLTATISNVGTRAIDMVTLFMRLPAGLTFNYVAHAEPNGYCNGGCNANAESAWDVGSLPAGSSRTISINAGAIPAAVGDGSLMSTAFALRGKDVSDINLLKTLQFYSKPAAQMVLSATKDPVLPSGTGSFDLDIGQIGPAALASTELRLSLPAGVTATTISDGGTQPSPGEIVWAIGGVTVSGVMHRKVDFSVGALPAGTLLPARATLTFEGGQPVDVVSETALSVTAAAPALKLDVTASPTPVPPGARLLYTVTVTNTAARAVDMVTLLMRVPTGMLFNYVADAEPDGYCNGGCNPESTSGWALGTLGVGMSKTITVNGLVQATVLDGSLVSATFQVKGAGLEDTLNSRITVPAHR